EHVAVRPFRGGYDDRKISFEAHEPKLLPKRPGDPRGHRVEDLLLRSFDSHQRRYPPQRDLLLSEPLQVAARLRIRDGRRHELRDGREPMAAITALAVEEGGA